MARENGILFVAGSALHEVLKPHGFERRGDYVIRLGHPITQLVAPRESRFRTRLADAAWIETLLYYGEPPAREHSFERLMGAEEAITSLRLDEIAPGRPSYYVLHAGANSDTLKAAIVADIRDALVPFLEATRDAQGAIARLSQLGSSRALQIAVLCARLGDLEQSRAFFSMAQGDRAAISRVAARFGVTLDGS